MSDNDYPISWTFPDWPDHTLSSLTRQHRCNLIHRSILAVIAGDASGLYDAFFWDGTPQGYDYWKDRALGFRKMSPRDVEQLMVWYAMRPVESDE